MNPKTLKDVIDYRLKNDLGIDNSLLARKFGVYRATIRKFKNNPEKVLVIGNELFPSMKEFPTGRRRK
jgi:DNA invertase Pin-like site-specific DNA recombinase